MNCNINGMAMMMMMMSSSSVEIHSFIDLSMGNWFLMEKLQFQWNSGGKEYKRKRQICHLMDMIECSLQRVSCEKARRKESVVFAISTRGCETISLIDLIDYNINYNLTAKWLSLTVLVFVLSPILFRKYSFEHFSIRWLSLREIPRSCSILPIQIHALL